MKRNPMVVMAALFLLAFSSAVAAQSNLNHLKSWADKYPTERKGRVTTRFFALPEVRTPLMRLLSRTDFNLLTKEYAVESPIKLVGNYLVAKVCMPHNCGEEQAGFAINLRTGVIYARMQDAEKERWFASKGSDKDLPKDVRDQMGDFGST
ncbi:MAG: hypothetical protein QOK48_942 [Blastocatellia bacterium]|nr:hypothetical protein [Blastocatellia bacterium]